MLMQMEYDVRHSIVFILVEQVVGGDGIIALYDKQATETFVSSLCSHRICS